MHFFNHSHSVSWNVKTPYPKRGCAKQTRHVNCFELKLGQFITKFGIIYFLVYYVVILNDSMTTFHLLLLLINNSHFYYFSTINLSWDLQDMTCKAKGNMQALWMKSYNIIVISHEQWWSLRRDRKSNGNGGSKMKLSKANFTRHVV